MIPEKQIAAKVKIPTVEVKRAIKPICVSLPLILTV